MTRVGLWFNVGARLRVAMASLTLLAAAGACTEPKSERVLLIEATTLAQSGRTDEARAILRRVHAGNPDSPDVLIRYAAFLIDFGELDEAAVLFARLDTLDVRGADAVRASTERRRYFQAIYTEAKGDVPGAPADVEAYERAVLGLINLERGGAIVDEYNQYLIARARAALGASPLRPIDLEASDNPATASTASQARAAVEYLDRLIDGDPRSEVPRPPEGPLAIEAEALRQALRLRLFTEAFDSSWTTRHRAEFIAEGRFDPATERLVLDYVGPFREGYDADSGLERLVHQAQTWHARELATDLAYRLAGIDREDAEPLPYAVEDFATATVNDARVTEDGRFAFRLVLPLATVQKGAFLLHRRVEEAAQGVADDEE